MNEAFEPEPEPETEAEVLRKGIEEVLAFAARCSIEPLMSGGTWENLAHIMRSILHDADRARGRAEREAEG